MYSRVANSRKQVLYVAGALLLSLQAAASIEDRGIRPVRARSDLAYFPD